jgi:hypothetical protein
MKLYCSSPFKWGGAPAGARGVRTPIKRSIDCIEHPFDAPQHVVVPETQHLESRRSQKPVTTLVVLQILRMLAAIELHHEHPIETGEVADVESHLMLPPELEACDLAAA